MLARWLHPENYGSFAIAFSLFLLLGMIHTSLFTEPMMVFGPGRFATQLRSYLEILIHNHWKLTAVGGLVFLILGVIFWTLELRLLALSFVGVSLACPFILVQWLVRRACFVAGLFPIAAYGGGIYMVLILLFMAGAYRFDLLSPVLAFGIMGAASGLSSFWIWSTLRVRFCVGQDLTTEKEVIGHHWQYGRWSLPTVLLAWVPANVFLLVLAMSNGIEATASLRALLNLYMPMLQINTALGALVVIYFGTSKTSHNFHSIVFKVVMMFLIGACVYWALIHTIGPTVIRFIYNGKYLESAYLLSILGIVPVLTGGIQVIGAVHRVLEKPHRIFWAYLFSALGSGTIGAILSLKLGISGAVLGMVLANAIILSTLFIIWLKDEVWAKGDSTTVKFAG